ncbi:MAG TPA: enoyl-CoA hydratase/isomerase family protein [Ktedonobacterales bacterium]|jgi:enoyl-CoA hydratase/carnithine racemase
MPTLELETMRCEVVGALGRLRLNRSQALNAANWQWVKDLVAATEYLAAQHEAHVVIVSGEGRAFCSGLDVKELAAGSLTPDWFDTWEIGVSNLERLDAITIAAVQGYCLGGGLQVVLACDLRVAATDAVLSIPAVREGVVAALGPMRLARQIGAARAKRLCLLGHRCSAEESAALDLVDAVVEPSALDARVRELADELLAIPFTALKETKRQINRAFDADMATLHAEMVAAQEECLRSPEHATVMATYREQQAGRKGHTGA